MISIEVVKRVLNQYLHVEHGRAGAQLRYPADGVTGDPGERLARDVVNALAGAGHLPSAHTGGNYRTDDKMSGY